MNKEELKKSSRDIRNVISSLEKRYKSLSKDDVRKTPNEVNKLKNTIDKFFETSLKIDIEFVILYKLCSDAIEKQKNINAELTKKVEKNLSTEEEKETLFILIKAINKKEVKKVDVKNKDMIFSLNNNTTIVMPYNIDVIELYHTSKSNLTEHLSLILEEVSNFK